MSRRDYIGSQQKVDQHFYYRPKHFAAGWEEYVALGGLEGMCKRKGLACKTLSAKPHHKAWEIVADAAVVLELPLFWFPNWKITVNDVDQEVRHHPTSGVITLRLPAGTHRVAATWTHGNDRKLGIVVSAAAVVILIATLLRRFHRGLQPRPRKQGLRGDV